jgi:hypothetical protein
MTINDYMPISLLNSPMKLLIKILVTRLQKVVKTVVVHQNQYGFIKDMTIQDCLVWAFQFFAHLSSIQKRSCNPQVKF